MCDEPFVSCPEIFVVIIDNGDLRSILVGSLRKNDNNTEALALPGTARCIVKCGCVKLYAGSLRAQECLRLRGINLAVNNVLLSCNKKDRIVSSNIDLAVSVILETV